RRAINPLRQRFRGCPLAQPSSSLFPIEEKLAAAKNGQQAQPEKERVQQQKALSSAGGNMIAASSTGDMLEEPAHLSNSQPKARSMETTSKARESNGNPSAVKMDAQLGAAFDQSMPGWSCRMPSEAAAKSELSLD